MQELNDPYDHRPLHERCEGCYWHPLNQRTVKEPMPISQNTRDLVIDISKGNPGALTVLIQLIESYGEAAIEHVSYIDGLTGSELWLLYKDVNKQNLQATYNAILSGPDYIAAALGDIRDSEFYNGQG